MKVLIEVATLLVILFGAYHYIDGKYAHAVEFQQEQQRTAENFRQRDLDRMQEQLNQLEAKQKYEGLTEYDELRKKELERSYERLLKQ